jgi:hypothetical protein
MIIPEKASDIEAQETLISEARAAFSRIFEQQGSSISGPEQLIGDLFRKVDSNQDGLIVSRKNNNNA